MVQIPPMTHRVLLPLVLALTILGTGTANAACYADYKAKQDNPLRLHYGVVKLPGSACDSKSAAKRAVAKKIGRDGWKVLSLLGIFDESGLNKRKSSAGAFYLKY